METNSTPSTKITKEEFLELLKMREAQSERLDKLSDAGFPIWDTDVIEYGNLMFDKIIKVYFTQIPMETMEDLWRFVKQYRK